MCQCDLQFCSSLPLSHLLDLCDLIKLIKFKIITIFPEYRWCGKYYLYSWDHVFSPGVERSLNCKLKASAVIVMVKILDLAIFLQSHMLCYPKSWVTSMNNTVKIFSACPTAFHLCYFLMFFLCLDSYTSERMQICRMLFWSLFWHMQSWIWPIFNLHRRSFSLQCPFQSLKTAVFHFFSVPFLLYNRTSLKNVFCIYSLFSCIIVLSLEHFCLFQWYLVKELLIFFF